MSKNAYRDHVLWKKFKHDYLPIWEMMDILRRDGIEIKFTYYNDNKEKTIIEVDEDWYFKAKKGHDSLWAKELCKEYNNLMRLRLHGEYFTQEEMEALLYVTP